MDRATLLTVNAALLASVLPLAAAMLWRHRTAIAAGLTGLLFGLLISHSYFAAWYALGRPFWSWHDEASNVSSYVMLTSLLVLIYGLWKPRR